MMIEFVSLVAGGNVQELNRTVVAPDCQEFVALRKGKQADGAAEARKWSELLEKAPLVAGEGQHLTVRRKSHGVKHLRMIFVRLPGQSNSNDTLAGGKCPEVQS